MPVAFYMDQNVSRAITNQLLARGVDVITAFEDNASELDDDKLLDRATELGRVLFTRDDDLLVEAQRRQIEGISFNGVIYAHQNRVSIGICVQHLEIIAKAAEITELMDMATYLPL